LSTGHVWDHGVDYFVCISMSAQSIAGHTVCQW